MFVQDNRVIDCFLNEPQETGTGGCLWEGNLGVPEAPGDGPLPSKLEVRGGKDGEELF